MLSQKRTRKERGRRYTCKHINQENKPKPKSITLGSYKFNKGSIYKNRASMKTPKPQKKLHWKSQLKSFISSNVIQLRYRAL